MAQKKKISHNQVEFRFDREGLSSVQESKTPVTLYFSCGSSQELKLSMDDGNIELKGSLTVYKSHPYTNWAPVLVTLDNSTKDYLRKKGGYAKIALCAPSAEKKQESAVVKYLGSDANLELASRDYGTLIALLEIRR